MFYQAGVEEFLSLVKKAEFIVMNSFHGMIFSVQFQRDFVIFSRNLCDNKIFELLDLFGLKDRLLLSGDEVFKSIDYNDVFKRILNARKESIKFLDDSLKLL